MTSTPSKTTAAPQESSGAAQGIYDGLVSRWLNRRISRPIARGLQHTPVTPNQVTLFTLLMAGGTLAAFMFDMHIVGGVLAQAGSIVDGVDGDLARLKGVASPFGSFFDALVDRYSDALVLLGLTHWTAGEHSATLVWSLGFAALAGTFAVTYARARIGEAHRTMFDRGWTALASRDVRLFVIMVGAIAGLGLPTLIGLAALTNVVAASRLIAAYGRLKS